MRPRSHPAKPYELREEDRAALIAIRHVYEGTASEAEQRRAMAFIIQRLCMVHDRSFVLDTEGGERLSAFIEGKRSVGHDLLKMIEVPVSQLLPQEVNRGRDDEPERPGRRGRR